MSYPKKEQILKIISNIENQKKIGKVNKLRPLPKNSDSIMKWKFKVSQKIAEFKIIRNLSLEEMSLILNSDPANISRILNGHIEKVTLDKLIGYLEIILIASKNKKLSDQFQLDADKFFNLQNLKFA